MALTRSFERHTHLGSLCVKPRKLNRQFLKSPLLQDRYTEGFGTLFTAEYDPKNRTLGLTLNGDRWDQALDTFEEGQRIIDYSNASAMSKTQMAVPQAKDGIDWSQAASFDWNRLAQDYATGQGREIHAYLPSAVSQH